MSSQSRSQKSYTAGVPGSAAAATSRIEHVSATAAERCRAGDQSQTGEAPEGSSQREACGAQWEPAPVVVHVCAPGAMSVCPTAWAAAVATALQIILAAGASRTPSTERGDGASRHEPLRDRNGRSGAAPSAPGGSDMTPTNVASRGRQVDTQDSRTRFEFLGPFRVLRGSEEVGLGCAQQRAVFALLLMRAPEPVSVDQLMDQVWGETPPATAEHAVQVYVSGIRKALRGVSEARVVRTSPAGYTMDIDLERVNAWRFERLIEQARRVLRAGPAQARDLFEQALSLWRSAPLAQFESLEWARREADRLRELREIALEGLAEARLALGEDKDVIGILTGLVLARPLRECPRRLLMLALYRSGRHAEALTAYRDACAAFDEIGLQPGPELRALEAAILRHDHPLLMNRNPRGRSSAAPGVA